MHYGYDKCNLAGIRGMWNKHAEQANISSNFQGFGDQETHSPRLQLLQTPKACPRSPSPFRSLPRQLSPQHDLEV